MTNALLVGDAAPWFRGVAVGGSADYTFHTVAGRCIVMLFAGQASRPEVKRVIEMLARHRARFDDTHASFFGVTLDHNDIENGIAVPSLPGVRWLFDHDGAISRHYGALERKGYRPHWVLLDRTLRVAATAPLGNAEHIFAALDALVRDEGHADATAPALIVPRVFEPEFCRHLIDYWQTGVHEDSGFMREVDGVTKALVDYGLKRRSDVVLADAKLQDAVRGRIIRFLLPMIERAFQFKATRIERYLIARYDDTGGYFGPHRDNTTKGTAHRRFACTINLNTEDYEGGDLHFPEFGARSWRAPTGGAVVFSCSLLHEAMPVTRGTRYAFLPFFYDESGAALREANQIHVEPAFRLES